MITIESYIIEGLLFLPVNEILSRFKYGKYSDAIDDDYIFIIGKEEGIPEFDHAYGLMASSHPMIMSLLADYDQYDSSQHSENMREPMKQGLKKAAEELGWDKVLDGFFGQPSFMNLIYKMIENRKKSRFKLGSSDIEIELDQLLSGEFLTLIINGITNKSNMQSFLQVLREKRIDILYKMRLMRVSIQGDDSVQFWRMAHDVTDKILSDLIQLFVDVSADNGMSLNFSKTVFRRFMYEYLKKVFVYGQSVGLFTQTLPLSMENRPDLPPIDMMKSWASTWSVSIGRGHNPYLVRVILLHFWSHLRRYRKDLRNAASTSMSFFPPIGLIYTPTLMKGIGLYPGGQLYASKDILLGYLISKNPDWKKVANRAAHVMDVQIDKISDKVAREVYRGKTTRPKQALSGIEKYYRRYVFKKHKSIASHKAIRKLKKAGVSVGDLAYDNFMQRSITLSLASNRKLVQQDMKMLKNAALMFVDRRKEIGKDYISEIFPWTEYIQLKPLERIPDILSHPVRVGLNDVYRNLQLQIGIGHAKNEYPPNPISFLFFLRRDPSFPRSITPEVVIKLLSHRKLVNEPELMQDALIAIGVSPDMAALAVTRFLTKNQTYQMYVNATQSKRDTFIPMLDLSLGNRERLFRHEKTGFHFSDAFLVELAFSHVVITAQTRGYARFVEVTFNDDGRANLVNFLRGDTLYDNIRYRDIFDDKE